MTTPRVAPIIMRPESVRAILAGRKTMTRRVLKPQPRHGAHVFQDGPDGYWYAHTKTGPGSDCVEVDGIDPGFAPGELRWVRETWQDYCPMWDGHWCGHGTQEGRVRDHQPVYRADPEDQWLRGPEPDKRRGPLKWRSPIHMPRWASRLTLRITAVKVERVQEISCADALREGIAPAANSQTIDCDTPDPRHAFRVLWDSINAHRPGCAWQDSPWVAAISFDPIFANVDDVLKGDSR